MKSSLLRIRPLAVAICAFTGVVGATAVGQTVATTDPVGFITLDVAGTGGTASEALSFKGLGLTRPVEYQGSAESVGSNTLTDNEATWSDDQFNGSNGAYYVELVSGTGAGTTYDIQATTASTKTITLAQPLGGGATNGVIFKVRKHWTFADVFGPNANTNNQVLINGGTATTADSVLIYDGTSYATYYYSNGGLIGQGWRKAGAGNANQGTTRIYPEDGIIIQRRQSANASVVLMGSVKTGQTSIPVFQGLNFVSNVYAANMTLGSSNLFTNNAATGVAAGTATTADQVQIYNSQTGTYETYYYSSGGLVGAGWRKAGGGNADQSAATIPVGTSIIIQRQNATAFNWVAPQHPATL